LIKPKWIELIFGRHARKLLSQKEFVAVNVISPWSFFGVGICVYSSNQCEYR